MKSRKRPIVNKFWINNSVLEVNVFYLSYFFATKNILIVFFKTMIDLCEILHELPVGTM